MKSSILHSSIRILLLGMIASIAPLNAAMAQANDDDVRSDAPSSTPPNPEEGTTTITPSESAPPPGQPEYRPGYEPRTTQPRGARGPIRTDMSQDNLRTTDRYVEGLPDYQKRLSSVFHAD